MLPATQAVQLEEPAAAAVPGAHTVHCALLAAEQAVKDRLKAQTEEAVARGVFGAPTFFVGEQMFWGQDRLDFVREALAN